jgi:hypothetical protein
MRQVFSIAILTLCCAVTGCDDRIVDIIELEDDGGADSDADSDSDTDSDADSETDTGPLDAFDVVVHTQQPFDAVPVKVKFEFHESVPPIGNPPGPSVPASEYNFQEPVLLSAVQPPFFDGDYHLVVVLFVEGGGFDAPVPGTDYHGWSPGPHTFGPGTGLVHVGDVNLNIVPF